MPKNIKIFLASFSRYIDDTIAIIGTYFNWEKMVYKTDDYSGIFPEQSHRKGARWWAAGLPANYDRPKWITTVITTITTNVDYGTVISII